MRLLFSALRGTGALIWTSVRVMIIAVLAATLGVSAVTFADYLATVPLTGTTFSSTVIATKHYANMVLCDVVLGAGSTSCASIVAGSGAASTSNPALVTTLSPSSAGFIIGQSNASDNVATGATNLPGIAYLYGFDGTTWDRLQVDASKNLKVTSAGSQSNATSAVATSATNATSVAWLYGFNGTTWDQLQVDASKNLKVVNTAADPCTGSLKSFAPVSQTANAQVITGTAAKKTYICSYMYNGSDAENISVVEGTGTVCATNTFALIGATTANAGNNFQTGSGAAQGNGNGTIAFGSADANATAANICVLQSGTGRVAGVIGYVQQ